MWHIESRSGQRMRAGLKTDRWKRGIEDYRMAAHNLLDSMKASGFDPQFPVPIDPDGELLDGAHRVACAIALGIEEITVEHRSQHVWAPEWGVQWFIDCGAPTTMIQRVLTDYEDMQHGPATDNGGLRTG
jgi:hypothetical protein